MQLNSSNKSEANSLTFSITSFPHSSNFCLELNVLHFRLRTRRACSVEGQLAICRGFGGALSHQRRRSMQEQGTTLAKNRYSSDRLQTIGWMITLPVRLDNYDSSLVQISRSCFSAGGLLNSNLVNSQPTIHTAVAAYKQYKWFISLQCPSECLQHACLSCLEVSSDYVFLFTGDHARALDQCHPLQLFGLPEFYTLQWMTNTACCTGRQGCPLKCRRVLLSLVHWLQTRSSATYLHKTLQICA